MKAAEFKKLYNEGRRDFSGANLRGAYLGGVSLEEADLGGADLTWANLTDADLTEADLVGADLTRANLTDANLTRANLTRANLRGANLLFTKLFFANLVYTDLPSPTMVMLATWGEVSDELCTDLMKYDAWFSNIPDLFDKWWRGGGCPYLGVKFQRACNFKEKRDLYQSGPPPGGFSLMVRLIQEKCADSDWHKK